MARMIPVGRIEVATDVSMAMQLREEGSETRGAALDLIGPALSEYPDVTGAAADAAVVAVDQVVAGLDLVEATQGPSDRSGFRGALNGRETELVVDTVTGLVPDEVLLAQAARLRTVAPTQNLPAVPASRGLVTRALPDLVPVVPSLNPVAFWGDSMFDEVSAVLTPTESVPARFAHYSGLPTYNGGRGGNSADEIAIRSGALVLMLTASGGTMPASGQERIMNVSGQRIGFRETSGFLAVQGEIFGRTGELRRSAAGTLLFKPTDGGAASPAVGAAAFIPTDGVQHRSALTFVIAGRNDVTSDGWAGGIPAVERILTATALIVEAQATQRRRVGLCGVMNAVNEPAGSAGHTKILQVEAALKGTWPDFWVGLRDYLVSEECYTGQGLPVDTVAVAEDRPGASLMLPGDNLHWTAATADLIAKRLHTWADEKEWLS